MRFVEILKKYFKVNIFFCQMRVKRHEYRKKTVLSLRHQFMVWKQCCYGMKALLHPSSDPAPVFISFLYECKCWLRRRKRKKAVG